MLTLAADTRAIGRCHTRAGTSAVQVPSYERRWAVVGSAGCPGQVTVTRKGADGRSARIARSVCTRSRTRSVTVSC